MDRDDEKGVQSCAQTLVRREVRRGSRLLCVEPSRIIAAVISSRPGRALPKCNMMCVLQYCMGLLSHTFYTWQERSESSASGTVREEIH